jgi:adenylate cyclase class 2
MQTEIEAKWLRIDINKMREKLESVGAVCVQKERAMQRKNYDYPDNRLRDIGGWIRVRNEGDKTTLSYKQLNDRTLHGTKEVNVTVDDFETACIFLESIGMRAKSYQVTKRESWELNGTQIELDTWPWIPSFIEIEATSEEVLKQTANILDLDFENALHGSVETAYQDVYDVTEEDIDSWEEIIFSDVPDWLVVKKK